MITPVRLQRSRAKGSRLVSPNGLPVVCVSRPGRWGNQYSVRRSEERGLWSVYHTAKRGDGSCRVRFICVYSSRVEAVDEAVELFRSYLATGQLGFTTHDVRRELAGKNLACWCKLGSTCHADVLLRVANGGDP